MIKTLLRKGLSFMLAVDFHHALRVLEINLNASGVCIATNVLKAETIVTWARH